MRIKCVISDLAKVPLESAALRLTASIHIDGPNNDLVIGQEYSVQAMERRNDGGIWFYLHTVNDNVYPYPYPAEYFQILDSEFPKNWTLKLLGDKTSFRAAFPEWASDDCFYERLVDEDKNTVSAYEKSRVG